MKETKQFNIPQELFVNAFKKVKANKGAYGIDKQSLEEFEMKLESNLYKLWNRMSSGSYFPSPVRAVEIPKKSGGKRTLGIPTVGDRVCQMVVKQIFEPIIDPVFLDDSYGYRPTKSAIDAIGVTRERCWKYDWILEFDIKALFDNISHELLEKALQRHTQEKWILLYVRRWLKAPIQQEDGTLKERNCGTPQGGVISPLLSNLFMHYAFDVWMQRNQPEMKWSRYADDGLIHCETHKQAELMLNKLKQRFSECGLELHPNKTRIVYCKDDKRRRKYPEKAFDFLGYTFRARRCKNSKNGSIFTSFTPAVSRTAIKSMKDITRKGKLGMRTDLSLENIAQKYNPILQGWFNYYGVYTKSALYTVFKHFNQTLIKWAQNKYKRLRRHKTRATKFLDKIYRQQPQLFMHWRIGVINAYA